MRNVPHAWVILKMTGPNIEGGVLYKLLMGWRGGFADADTWRLNSGIKSFSKTDSDYVTFTGYSGTQYKCVYDYEKMSLILLTIFEQLKETLAVGSDGTHTVEIINFENFEKEFNNPVEGK